MYHFTKIIITLKWKLIQLTAWDFIVPKFATFSPGACLHLHLMFLILCYSVLNSEIGNRKPPNRTLCEHVLDHIKSVLPYKLLLMQYNQTSSGSRISRRGGRRPRRGGANSRGSYVSKNLYVKTKESGPVGGRAPAAPPPGSATVNLFHVP